MTLVELLIVIAILSGLVLLVAPTAQKIIRRSQLVAAHSTLKQALASARLQAVKRGANVVVLMSLSPENKLRLVTFQDRANDETNPLPADEDAAAGNFVRNTGFAVGSPGTDEPILGDILLPTTVAVWKQGGTKNDLTSGIAFDGYAADSSLTDRVAFLPTGGIAPPEDTVNSGPPADGRRTGDLFRGPGRQELFPGHR